jgi:hypothetical protein
MANLQPNLERVCQATPEVQLRDHEAFNEPNQARGGQAGPKLGLSKFWIGFINFSIRITMDITLFAHELCLYSTTVQPSHICVRVFRRFL